MVRSLVLLAPSACSGTVAPPPVATPMPAEVRDIVAWSAELGPSPEPLRPPLEVDPPRSPPARPAPTAARPASAPSLPPPPPLACVPPDPAPPLVVAAKRHQRASFSKGYDVGWFAVGVPAIDGPVEQTLRSELADYGSIREEHCGRGGQQACTMHYGCRVDYNDGNLFIASCDRYDDVGNAGHPRAMGEWFFNFERTPTGWARLGNVEDLFVRAEAFLAARGFYRPEEQATDHYRFDGTRLELAHDMVDAHHLDMQEIVAELACPLRFAAAKAARPR
jgi:hypothetical protein